MLPSAVPLSSGISKSLVRVGAHHNTVPQIGLPFYFVRPVSGRHFSFGNVGSVASFEGLTTFAVGVRFAFSFRRAGDALLSEADGFNFVTFFSDDNVGFCRVVWCALGFVDTRDTDAGEE